MWWILCWIQVQTFLCFWNQISVLQLLLSGFILRPRSPGSNGKRRLAEWGTWAPQGWSIEGVLWKGLGTSGASIANRKEFAKSNPLLVRHLSTLRAGAAKSQILNRWPLSCGSKHCTRLNINKMNQTVNFGLLSAFRRRQEVLLLPNLVWAEQLRDVCSGTHARWDNMRCWIVYFTEILSK